MFVLALILLALPLLSLGFLAISVIIGLLCQLFSCILYDPSCDVRREMAEADPPNGPPAFATATALADSISAGLMQLAKFFEHGIEILIPVLFVGDTAALLAGLWFPSLELSWGALYTQLLAVAVTFATLILTWLSLRMVRMFRSGIVGLAALFSEPQHSTSTSER